MTGIHYLPLTTELFALFADDGVWLVDRLLAAYIVIEELEGDGEVRRFSYIEGVTDDSPGDVSEATNFFRYARGDESARPYGFDGTVAQMYASQHKGEREGPDGTIAAFMADQQRRFGKKRSAP